MKRAMVVTALREAGVPREVAKVILTMHDDVVTMQHHIKQLYSMLDQLTNILHVHGNVLVRAQPLLSAVEKKAKELGVSVAAEAAEEE